MILLGYNWLDVVITTMYVSIIILVLVIAYRKLIRFLNKIPGFSGLFQSLYEVKDARLEREVFGIKFKNPVGLAAGFDKDAKLYQELSNFGFGFIEIGTLTPVGQEGNPKKRLFRLKEDNAIINRMGFNNGGVLEAVCLFSPSYRFWHIYLCGACSCLESNECC